jgi:hypothetical protein
MKMSAIERSEQSFAERIEAGSIKAHSPVEKLLLCEYGAMFVADGVTPPPFVVFPDAESVHAFQTITPHTNAVIGGIEFTLQTEAMTSLVAAVEQARATGLCISPRGPDSAARDYPDTVTLWESRVEPALDYWLREGRISAEIAERIRRSEPFDQVPIVLELEQDGIYFAKDLSKSIIYSVAPPGASQHLAMLAFDVAEFDEPEVRSVLASNGWFQTVTSDLPHFTYLGVDEYELSGRGLKRVESGGRVFWIPDL